MVSHCETGKSWAVPTLRLLQSLADNTGNLSTLSVTKLWSNNDVAIGHNSVPYNIAATTQQLFEGSRIPKISTSQISTFERGQDTAFETCIDGVHMTEGGIVQISSGQVTILQIGGAQVSISENSTDQQSPVQIDPLHFSINEDGFRQINVPQIGSTQVYTPQVNSLEVYKPIVSPWLIEKPFVNQFDSSKITFSTAISNQKFLSTNLFTHIATLVINQAQSINLLENIGDDNFFASSFDLELEIDDRPTVQLPEANITHFDPTGRRCLPSNLTQTDSLLNDLPLRPPRQ
jgi:hypothetical protein